MIKSRTEKLISKKRNFLKSIPLQLDKISNQFFNDPTKAKEEVDKLIKEADSFGFKNISLNLEGPFKSSTEINDTFKYVKVQVELLLENNKSI